jgi:uncharacterized protein DUF6675
MHFVRAAQIRAVAIWAIWICMFDMTFAQYEPRPPCAGALPYPVHAPAGTTPAVAVWSNGDAARWIPLTCVGWPASQRFKIIVALAGNFRHDGNADDLLARFGAVSIMRGLRYWSVTDKAWRTLITDSFAVDGPDAKQHRPDFNPDELKSGTDFFFAQDDSRSSGFTVYLMRVLEQGPSRIVLETENVTPVRVLIFTLFPPGSLRATYILERRGPRVWGFYGISGTGEGASVLAGGHEASYINRAVALYRYFTGVPGDAEPPLAP